ncbi:MAG: DUF2934 domain-containing protein [Pseudomonadota bacterium]
MVADEKQSTDETLRPKIEQRAYEIWRSEGSPRGCDVDHWLRAEVETMSSQACTTPTPNVESQSTLAKGQENK